MNMATRSRLTDLRNELHLCSDLMKYFVESLVDNMDDIPVTEDLLLRISICKDRIQAIILERNQLNVSIVQPGMQDEHRQREEDDLFVDNDEMMGEYAFHMDMVLGKQDPTIMREIGFHDNTDYDCGVCYETLERPKIVHFDCDHFMCLSCLCKHIASSKTLQPESRHYLCHICRSPICTVKVDAGNFQEIMDELQLALVN